MVVVVKRNPVQARDILSKEKRNSKKGIKVPPINGLRKTKKSL